MQAFSRGYGVVAVLGLLSATGCLRKELTHTIYVSPSSVTWSAMEKDVRSEEADPTNRMLEEHDYILGARAGRHGVARALGLLGGTRVDTTILRHERPFTVLTEGQFGNLGELALAMMRALHVRGDARVDRDGCEKTFRAWVDVESNQDDAGNPVVELMAEASSYRLVLTDGSFIGGEGFSIEEEDRTIAVPGAPGEVEDGIARVSLRWKESGCAGARP
jgi:hypothetical protein